MKQNATYRFGPFRLDTARRTLQHETADYVHLAPKVFRCLVYLVEHRDRAVSHKELFDAIWGTEHLSAGVIPQTMLQLRQALGDAGEGRQYIETLRGYGYRWTAPVDTGNPDADPAPEPSAEEAMWEPASAPPAAVDAEPPSAQFAATVAEPEPGSALVAPPHSKSRRFLFRAVAALALVAVLGTLIFHLYRERISAPAPLKTDGNVALLLPVTVEAGAEDAWVRLGVMDLVAEQLRSAGLSMVSSDTVIALLGQNPGAPATDGYQGLTDPTGAKLVMAGRAQKRGGHWSVSLEVVKGTDTPVVVAGEANDVIEAARIASGKMTSALGLAASKTERPNLPPAVARLAQQIRAAILAGEPDAAGSLILNADASLRRHPEIRFLEGHADVIAGRLDAAQKVFEGLLGQAEDSHAANPAFRGQVLYNLGIVSLARNTRAESERLLQRALKQVEGMAAAPSWAAYAHMALGIIAMERDDLEAASGHLAQARIIAYSDGNLRALATVDKTMGLLEEHRERPASALRYLQGAVGRFQALGARFSELLTRALIQQMSLLLLDRDGAIAQQPRIRELMRQVQEPASLGEARMAQAALDDAGGRLADSRAQLRLVLELTRANPGREWSQPLETAALGLLAKQFLQDGQAPQAVAMAKRVVAMSPVVNGPERAQAWLTLVRAQMASGDMAGAQVSLAVFRKFVHGKSSRQAGISLLLAQAEMAAAGGSSPAAVGAVYEQAFAQAEDVQIPAQMLDVISSYVPWLLRGRQPDLERAKRLADRVAPYTDSWYEAALVQLQVYQAIGDKTAESAALDRVRGLAGERRIPPRLQASPSR